MKVRLRLGRKQLEKLAADRKVSFRIGPDWYEIALDEGIIIECCQVCLEDLLPPMNIRKEDMN